MAEPVARLPLPRKASEIPQKERFFRYFQQEVTGELQDRSMKWRRVDLVVPALQEQMERLRDTALVGGERTDATDHLVAGIARLGSEVGDASSYLPAYDQRTYGEVILRQILPTGFSTSQT